MARKRKNGEGCYGTKKIKGVEYRFYRFPDGRYVYAKTAKQLAEKKKKMEMEQRIEDPSSDKDFVFVEYAEKWLKTRYGEIEDKTYDGYESSIHRIDRYDVGHRQIATLNADMFTLFLSDLAKKYSRSTIKQTWAVVRGTLEYGQNRREIPQFEISDIRLPREKESIKRKKSRDSSKENRDMSFTLWNRLSFSIRRSERSH